MPRGGYLKKVLLIITDGLTTELCIGAYLFSRSVIRIGQKSGWLHCALYLKQCASSRSVKLLGSLFSFSGKPVGFLYWHSGNGVPKNGKNSGGAPTFGQPAQYDLPKH